jgi:hypothetical protein
MVFLLEDIAKIEDDRRTDLGIVENFTHLQKTRSIIQDPKAHDAILDITLQYLKAAKHYVWGRESIDFLGVFADAFMNAGMWGNEDMPGRFIRVCVKYGLLGSVATIQDQGCGFDYNSQIRKLEEGEMHDFSRHGGGMRKFHEYQGCVSYHGCGNLISIATKAFSFEEFDRFCAG